jgi:outer membrane biosynthesis protein TonB
MYWVEPRNLRDFAMRNPLVAAFAISLAIHVALFGGWKLGKSLGWFDHQATWLLNILKKKPVKISAKQLAQLQAQQQKMREIPLTFVEVDPAVAVTEAPKDAKFYSALNSKASNPDVKMEEHPKVDGKQTQIVKTETTPRLNPQPLQPSPPPPDKAAEQPKPKTEPKGDLATAEPDPGDSVVIPTKERPRTLAMARVQKNIVGEKVQQDGGVKRRGKIEVDAKATPFGAYDLAFIAAVQARWYQILDSHNFVQRSGKVVIEFRLTYDGRITEMRVAGNEVGDLLGLACQNAIMDPAPYAPWPQDMRRLIGGNHRDVTFTFYYY